MRLQFPGLFETLVNVRFIPPDNVAKKQLLILVCPTRIPHYPAVFQCPVQELSDFVLKLRESAANSAAEEVAEIAPQLGRSSVIWSNFGPRRLVKKPIFCGREVKESVFFAVAIPYNEPIPTQGRGGMFDDSWL